MIETAKMSKVNDLSKNEDKNNVWGLNLLNCSLNGKRECAKTQELRKRIKAEKEAAKPNKRFRKKSSVDRVFSPRGLKGCHSGDYLNCNGSAQSNDVRPESFLGEKSPNTGNFLGLNRDYLLEDNCKENDTFQLNLESGTTTNPFDNLTDIGLDCVAGENLVQLMKPNQRSDKVDSNPTDFPGAEYTQCDLDNEEFGHLVKEKEENYFLFKNDEMLVKCEVPPANEQHLVLNNIMLNGESGDYSFPGDAFSKPDFELDKASCFDYAEIGFACDNLAAVNEDLAKVDEKCEPAKRPSQINQLNCATFQPNLIQNLTDYTVDRSISITPNAIVSRTDSGDFPTYSNVTNTSNDLVVLEAHLNLGNFQPNSNPNEATNESKSINDLDLNSIIESPDGLQLNGATLLNALLSNQIVVSEGGQLNGILRGGNKMVSSCLIGDSISSKLSLSGEIMTTAQLTDSNRNCPENDCYSKLNSISLKLPASDESQAGVLFARNLDDYLASTGSLEAEPELPVLIDESAGSTITAPEINSANQTPRKSANKPKSNSLTMPISSDCLSSSPARLIDQPAFLQLNPSASPDSNYLNSLYSLANNINNPFSVIGHHTSNCSKVLLEVDDVASPGKRNRPEKLSNSLTKSVSSKNSPSTNTAKRSSCNPFSIECRIPLPNTLASDHSILVDNKNFIKRRNQRERIRVKSVNDGFDRLRKHLPADYEQYLDPQSPYSNCFLKSSGNLNSSTNSTTSEGPDLKSSIYTAFSGNSDEAYPEEASPPDRKPLNQFKDQASIGYSNSSGSSTTSIPTSKERRLSKVETLRLAINYIRHLENVLSEESSVLM